LSRIQPLPNGLDTAQRWHLRYENQLTTAQFQVYGALA
jgi:hypothetical protein